MSEPVVLEFFIMRIDSKTRHVWCRMQSSIDRHNTTQHNTKKHNATQHQSTMQEFHSHLLLVSRLLSRLRDSLRLPPPTHRTRYYWCLRSPVQTQLNAARRPEQCKQLAKAPGEVARCLFSLLQNAHKEILESEKQNLICLGRQ